jgi:hypothetical protein
LVSSPPQCSSTPVGFGQGFLSKDNVTTWSIPNTLLTWLQLIFTFSSTEISTEGTAIL